MATLYDKLTMARIHRILVIDEDGHWLHRYQKNHRPTIVYKGKKWFISRLMLKLLSSKFDKSLQANHSCDNEYCFNPLHLYQGTQKENMKDYYNSDYWKFKKLVSTVRKLEKLEGN